MMGIAFRGLYGLLIGWTYIGSPAFSQIVEPIELENTKRPDEGNPTSKSSTPIPLSPNPSSIVAGTKVPTSKRQYDSVDISRMDVDESKITDRVLEYQTKTTAVRDSSEIDRSNELLTVPSTPLNEMTGQADDDDLYEPPATLDLDVENVVSDRKPEIPERPLLETTLPDSAQIATVSEEDNNSMPQISKIANTTYEESDAEDEKRDSDRSVLLAEISDSDDYEPPEPAPLVETPALQSVGESFHRESYLPIQIIDVENESKAMPPEPKETISSTVSKDFNPQNVCLSSWASN